MISTMILLVQYMLKSPGKDIFLPTAEQNACRFCKKKSPGVTFKLKAHAIPELLGNKTLFSTYECNSCNKCFGQGIENDLGNWSKPIRNLTRIRGKKGVPTLRKGSSGGWRIEAGPAGLEIREYEGDRIVAVDEVAKTVTFRLSRDPYTPVGVLKAFVKIALTLLPDEEVCHFQHAFQWIKEKDHAKSRWEFPIYRTFQPGPFPNNLLVALILRRKPDALNVPYAFLILSYGNEVYQVIIPTPEKDMAESSQTQFTFMQFPVVLDVANYMPYTPQRKEIDLSGHEIVKGNEENYIMTFEHVTHRRIEPLIEKS